MICILQEEQKHHNFTKVILLNHSSCDSDGLGKESRTNSKICDENVRLQYNSK